MNAISAKTIVRNDTGGALVAGDLQANTFYFFQWDGTNFRLMNPYNLGSLVKAGSYSGNGGVNRAIAHGLGATPKVVFITGSNAGYFYGINGNIGFVHNFGDIPLSVTAPDSTNFYVGNSSNYATSANNTGDTYYWVAFR